MFSFLNWTNKRFVVHILIEKSAICVTWWTPFGGKMYRLMCVLCTCDLDDSTCLKFCSIQLHVIIVWWEMNFHWALEWERWRLGYHIPSPSGFLWMYAFCMPYPSVVSFFFEGPSVVSDWQLFWGYVCYRCFALIEQNLFYPSQLKFLLLSNIIMVVIWVICVWSILSRNL
jgi:hypothetical protein